MFHNQTAQFVSVVAQNIPEMSDDIMQDWIENPRGLQKFLAGLNSPTNGVELKVWRTLKLGTGIKDANGFCEAIKSVDMRLSDYASDIMSKPAFSVASEAQEVDLVVISVAELGFKKGAMREKIYQRALERGLQLCPNEVGPQLRLDYKEQPLNEWFVIGMEPITASYGRLGLFYVERNDDGLWLNSHYGSPGYIWNADDRFVFVRPRK